MKDRRSAVMMMVTIMAMVIMVGAMFTFAHHKMVFGHTNAFFHLDQNDHFHAWHHKHLVPFDHDTHFTFIHPQDQHELIWSFSHV